MRRGSGGAAAALAMAMLLGCSQDPDTLVRDYDEKEMEQAIERARSTFDQFLERFRSPEPGDEAFSVKVRIEDPNGIEHFWLENLKLDAEPYSGDIGNDPGIVKSVRLGQRHSFSRKDISDWMYMANGKMEGNFTLRVTLKSMPKEKAEAVKRRIGW